MNNDIFSCRVENISATRCHISAAIRIMCLGFLGQLSNSVRAARHQLDASLFLFLLRHRESRISAAKEHAAADNFL